MAEVAELEDIEALQELDASIGTVPRPYEAFQRDEGILVHRGFQFDISDLDTGPWERTGQAGAFVNLHGAQGVTDIHVHDVSPGEATTVQNNLFEEVVYVAWGEGTTEIGFDGEVAGIQWSPHSLFLLPPRTPYRHRSTGHDTARLVAQTTLPQFFKFFKHEEYLFDLDGAWSREPSFFSPEGSTYRLEDSGFQAWSANVIQDLMHFEDVAYHDGVGAQAQCQLLQEESCMGGHIGVVPARMYKKAHRHGPAATLFILSGEGYSLLWREGWDKYLKIEWQEGSIFSPPALWYHNHYNATGDPIRKFAVHGPEFGTLSDPGNPVFYYSHPENVIDYVEEDPVIRETFEAELAERGVDSAMPEACYRDPEYELKV